MEIVKLENGILPTRAHQTDAGMDLYTPKAFLIKGGETKKISLGIKIKVPPNHVAIVQGKSGLAVTRGITTIGNIIDEGYTGEISAILANISFDQHEFKAGDKIAQLLVVPVSYVSIEPVESFIGDTERGDNGFGSTGKNKSDETLCPKCKSDDLTILDDASVECVHCDYKED